MIEGYRPIPADGPLGSPPRSGGGGVRRPGGLNDIEISAFDAPLNAGQKRDGGAVDYAIISIAISLKRIADALEKR